KHSRPQVKDKHERQMASFFVFLSEVVMSGKEFFCAAKLVNFSKTPEHSGVTDIFLRHIYSFLRQPDDTYLKMQEKISSNECKTDPCRSSAQGIQFFCHAVAKICHAFQEKQHQPLNDH
ncbi:MAG: hypothetical protein MR710_05460, partial [Bacteroidales bacterium]|nr:hypothetical protein [Bacteroidales bacterium]